LTQPSFYVQASTASFVTQAEKAKKVRNFAECKRLCEAVLRINKDEMNAVEILALCALETQHFAEAFDAARKLTDAEPMNVNGAMIASVALMNTGQDELAVHVLEDQISRTPDVPGLFSICILRTLRWG